MGRLHSFLSSATRTMRFRLKGFKYYGTGGIQRAVVFHFFFKLVTISKKANITTTVESKFPRSSQSMMPGSKQWWLFVLALVSATCFARTAEVTDRTEAADRSAALRRSLMIHDMYHDLSMSLSMSMSMKYAKGKKSKKSKGSKSSKGKGAPSKSVKGKGKEPPVESPKGKGKETSSESTKGKGKGTASESTKGKGKGKGTTSKSTKGKGTSSKKSKGKGAAPTPDGKQSFVTCDTHYLLGKF